MKCKATRGTNVSLRKLFRSLCGRERSVQEFSGRSVRINTAATAKRWPHLVTYAMVDDVGKAAKDWPQLNFRDGSRRDR
jgi:hypothetical protein